jgi:hypothetical protein
MKITLGNLDQHLVFNGVPTKASEVFTAKGNWKFTVSGAIPGAKLKLLNDVAFNKFFMLAQTQNTPVNFGFTGADGILANNPPHSSVGHNQQSLLLYKEAHGGQVDVHNAPYITIELVNSAAATFTANLA